MTDIDYLEATLTMARENVDRGGGPFACLIVRDGVVVGEGTNVVTLRNDPTAHAEVVAIRDACARLTSFQLAGCVVYASCEPCPMCLGALYWARPDRVVYAADRAMAAEAGFDDGFIYDEIHLPDAERSLSIHHMPSDGAQAPFNAWKAAEGKTRY
ncbi:MAG: nucleoside deaminase [Rhodothermales bacterium]